MRAALHVIRGGNKSDAPVDIKDFIISDAKVEVNEYYPHNYLCFLIARCILQKLIDVTNDPEENSRLRNLVKSYDEITDFRNYAETMIIEAKKVMDRDSPSNFLWNILDINDLLHMKAACHFLPREPHTLPPYVKELLSNVPDWGPGISRYQIALILFHRLHNATNNTEEFERLNELYPLPNEIVNSTPVEEEFFISKMIDAVEWRYASMCGSDVIKSRFSCDVVTIGGGGEASGDAPSTPMIEEVSENDDDKDICIICWDKKREYAIVPCGHRVFCVDCKDRCGSACPICRGAMTSVMRVIDS